MLQAVGISKKIDFSEYVVWSFFVSGLVDLALILALQLPVPPSTDTLVAGLATWYGASTYVVLVFVAAVGGALVLRFNPGKRLQKLVWLRSKARRIPSLVWDDSLEAHFGQWLIVETSDGKLVYGLLMRYSTGHEPREVYLASPALITFDDDRRPVKTPLGAAILITGDNLRALRFLSSPTDLQIVLAGNARNT